MKHLIALVLLAMAVVLLVPRSRADTPTTAPTASAVVVSLTGEIDDFNRDSFFRRFKQAKAAGAKVIVVRISTYGGLVTAGLEISQFIKGQNDVHTIAFVNDKAISAGAMIAMACDEIVMSNNAILGDCAPIAFRTDGTLEPMPAAERAKSQSPILADFADSAERNHHDPLLARAMVDVNVDAYWIQSPSGEMRFVEGKDYKKLTADGWKDVANAPVPVDSSETLLTVTTPLAVKLGLASGKSASVESLAQERNFNITATYDSGFGEAFIGLLNAGWMRMVLIIIFGTSIYAALHAPGHGTAEALALTSLGLLIGVPLLAGYANWWEVVLILGGLVLIAFEIFVFPHAGLMIALGIIMMAVGLVLTFVGTDPGSTPFAPKLPGTWLGLRNGVFYVCGGLVGTALLSWWLSQYLPKMPYFSRLVLNTTNAAASTTVAPMPLAWPIPGAVGRAITPLGPGGSAEFPDRTGADVTVFSVVSESGFLPVGAPVIVRESGGGRVVVRSTV